MSLVVSVFLVHTTYPFWPSKPTSSDLPSWHYLPDSEQPAHSQCDCQRFTKFPFSYIPGISFLFSSSFVSICWALPGREGVGNSPLSVNSLIFPFHVPLEKPQAMAEETGISEHSPAYLQSHSVWAGIWLVQTQGEDIRGCRTDLWKILTRMTLLSGWSLWQMKQAGLANSLILSCSSRERQFCMLKWMVMHDHIDHLQ